MNYKPQTKGSQISPQLQGLIFRKINFIGFVQNNPKMMILDTIAELETCYDYYNQKYNYKYDCENLLTYLKTEFSKSYEL
jgi:hypothetical protein